MKLVLLDSHPLSLLCASPRRAEVVACRQWRDDLILSGHMLIIPEIIDYEVRRELLRSHRMPSVGRLNQLRQELAYLPLNSEAIERAAALWAHARQIGQPTAADDTIDIDMILLAQAESLQLPNTVIATSNVGHLAGFFPSDLWSNIAP